MKKEQQKIKKHSTMTIQEEERFIKQWTEAIGNLTKDDWKDIYTETINELIKHHKEQIAHLRRAMKNRLKG